MSDNPLRQLPAVNEVLDHPALTATRQLCAHELVVAAIRDELDGARKKLRGGEPSDRLTDIEQLAMRIAARLEAEASPRFRTVINATGIVLHTNLGRAPLAEEAAAAAYEAGRGYLNLEIDLTTGKRSSRQQPIRDLLIRLTGAESATVVNNCAAATVIALRALATGKEAIVARGQLIEIGGGFRIPEIMAVSGATLWEVGTTNIVRLNDYERAIGPNTGLIMRIHPSNYRVRGFTEEVSLEDLVALGRQRGLPVLDDVGSGAFIDLAEWGLTGEPTVRASITAGADVVICSGDKLLGGPQAGLILGKRAFIERIERDPLMRAFRLDKMTLAALEATLLLYLNPDEALWQVPALRALTAKHVDLQWRADALAGKLEGTPGIHSITTGPEEGYAGGGSLPDQPLPSVTLALTLESIGTQEFAERLRLGNPAVLARIHDGKVHFDLRTVFEREEAGLIRAVKAALTPR